MADAADAVAEVTPEAAPAVEAAPAEVTPAAVEGEAAPVAAADAPDLAWVEEFGGLDKVKEAAEFRRSATTTEDGAIDAFVEFGVALGLTPAQLAELFPAEAAAAAAASEEDDAELDRPISMREFRELLAQEVLQPLQQRDEQAKVAEMRTVITSQLDAAKVPETARGKVLEFADAHVSEADRFNKDKVSAAVTAGLAEYETWLDSLVQERIGKKVAANGAVPTPVSGGATGGGEEQAEPMTLAEAKARVRAQYPRT